MTKKKLIEFILALSIVAFLWGMGILLEDNINPYVVRVIINCAIGMMLAMSLNLVNGCAGQFSLGHAGFMAVGAYMSAACTTVLFPNSFFQTPIGTGVAIVIGGLGAAFAGLLVGLPSLRLKG